MYNPYVTTIACQEGIREIDVRRHMRASTPKKRDFPCTIHGRHFATKKQYLEELHEFLNGN